MVRINLIPKHVQWSQARQVHIKRWVVSGLVVAGAVAVALGIDGFNRAKADGLRKQGDLLRNELQQVRADLRSMTQKVQQVVLRIERAEVLRGKRTWSGIFALIDQAMPKGCWLVSAATVPDVPMSASSQTVRHAVATNTRGSKGSVTIDAPRSLKLVGYAPGTGEPHSFITALKRAGVFKQVTLVRSQREMVLDGSYFRFELECGW